MTLLPPQSSFHRKCFGVRFCELFAAGSGAGDTNAKSVSKSTK